jgi:nitrate reductase beta subunit
MTKETDPKRLPHGSYEAGLSSSIEELESLIDDTARVTINTHPAIPVLDDAIDPDEFYEEELHTAELYETEGDGADDNDSISRDELENLIENMERKLAGELDALVNILKDAIKDSIMTEIKTQLEERRPNPPENPSLAAGEGRQECR